MSANSPYSPTIDDVLSSPSSLSNQESPATTPTPPMRNYLDAMKFAKSKGFTVTSTTRGEHNPGSAHPLGLAVDVRTRDKTPEQVAQLARDARGAGLITRDERTRPAGQKIWSGPHYHLEIPRGKKAATVVSSAVDSPTIDDVLSKGTGNANILDSSGGSDRDIGGQPDRGNNQPIDRPILRSAGTMPVGLGNAPISAQPEAPANEFAAAPNLQAPLAGRVGAVATGEGGSEGYNQTRPRTVTPEFSERDFRQYLVQQQIPRTRESLTKLRPAFQAMQMGDTDATDKFLAIPPQVYTSGIQSKPSAISTIQPQIGANDLAWHLGMSPSTFQQLSPAKRNLVIAAVARQVRADKGKQVTEPDVNQKNELRTRLGLEPISSRYAPNLSTAMVAQGLSPFRADPRFHMPRGGRIPTSMEMATRPTGHSVADMQSSDDAKLQAWRERTGQAKPVITSKENAVQAASPDVVSRAAVQEFVRNATPGLQSLNTQAGINTGIPEQIAATAIRDATLGAFDFKVNPNHFQTDADRELGQHLGTVASFAASLIPFVGAAKAVRMARVVPAIAKSMEALESAGIGGRALSRAIDSAATFGGVQAGKEFVANRQGRGEPGALGRIGEESAFGSVLGGLTPSNATRASSAALFGGLGAGKAALTGEQSPVEITGNKVLDTGLFNTVLGALMHHSGEAAPVSEQPAEIAPASPTIESKPTNDISRQLGLKAQTDAIANTLQEPQGNRGVRVVKGVKPDVSRPANPPLESAKLPETLPEPQPNNQGLSAETPVNAAGAGGGALNEPADGLPVGKAAKDPWDLPDSIEKLRPTKEDAARISALRADLQFTKHSSPAGFGKPEKPTLQDRVAIQFNQGNKEPAELEARNVAQSELNALETKSSRFNTEANAYQNRRWEEARQNGDVKFIRFGKPPKSSRNFRDSEDLGGVSAYEAIKHADGSYELAPKINFLLSGPGFIDRQAYEVDGKQVGEGPDGEPLLDKARIVHNIPAGSLYHPVGGRIGKPALKVPATDVLPPNQKGALPVESKGDIEGQPPPDSSQHSTAGGGNLEAPPVVNETVHHSNFENRNDDGTFAEGAVVRPSGSRSINIPAIESAIAARIREQRAIPHAEYTDEGLRNVLGSQGGSIDDLVKLGIVEPIDGRYRFNQNIIDQSTAKTVSNKVLAEEPATPNPTTNDQPPRIGIVSRLQRKINAQANPIDATVARHELPTSEQARTEESSQSPTIDDVLSKESENAANTGKNESDREEELRGIRSGTDVSTHGGEVREGSSKQAENRGGPEGIRAVEKPAEESQAPKVNPIPDRTVTRKGNTIIAPDGTEFTGKRARARAEEYAQQKSYEGATVKSYGGGLDKVVKVEPAEGGLFKYTVSDAKGNIRTHKTQLGDKDVVEWPNPEIGAKTEQKIAKLAKSNNRKVYERSLDTQKHSLSEAVRQMGGIKPDRINVDAGEIRRLSNRETGTSGIVNSKSGIPAERMMLALREHGYPIPDDAKPSDLMDMVESDLRGTKKTYSSEHDYDFEAEYMAHDQASQQKADNLKSFYENPRVVPLFEKVVHAGTESLSEREVNELYRQATNHDVSAEVHQFLEDNRGEETPARTSDAVQERVESPRPTLDSLRKPETGLLGFDDELQLTNPDVEPTGKESASQKLKDAESKRQRDQVSNVLGDESTGKLEKFQQSPIANVKEMASRIWDGVRNGSISKETANQKIAAMDKFSGIKARGMTVDDYLNTPNMFEEPLSAAQGESLKELEKLPTVREKPIQNKTMFGSGLADLAPGVKEFLGEDVAPHANRSLALAKRATGLFRTISSALKLNTAEPVIKNLGEDAHADVMRAIHTGDAKTTEFNAQQSKVFDASMNDLRRQFNRLPGHEMEDFNLMRGTAETDGGQKLQQEAADRLKKSPNFQQFDKLGKAVKDASDSIWQYATDAGLDMDYFKDYFYGNYKDPAKVDRFMEYWKTTDKYLKEKSIPTIADASAFGLELKDKNPITNLESEMHAVGRRVGLLKLRDKMVTDKAPYMIETEGLDDAKQQALVKSGWESINDPVFKGMKFDPNFAKLVNTLLETSKTGNNVFLKGMQATNRLLRQIKFMGSVFHMTNMLKASVANEALGTADPRGYLKFGKAFKAVDKSDPAYVDYVNLGGGHGYSAEVDAAGQMQRGLERLGRGNILGGAPRLAAGILKSPFIPGGPGFSNWMFSDYIPTLKYAKFQQDMMDGESKLGRPLNDAEKIRIIKRNQNFYGEMNEKLFGRSATATQALRILFTAPGYGEGNFRAFGRAVIGDARSARFVASSILTSAIAATVATRILTGHWPPVPQTRKELRNVFKIQTGLKDQAGRELNVDALTYDKDFWMLGSAMTGGYATDTTPGEEVRRRISGAESPAMGALADMSSWIRTGHVLNWKGQEVIKPGQTWEDKAKAIGGEAMELVQPIPLSGYQDAREKGFGPLASTGLAMSGIRTASKYDPEAKGLLYQGMKQSGQEGRKAVDEMRRLGIESLETTRRAKLLETDKTQTKLTDEQQGKLAQDTLKTLTPAIEKLMGTENYKKMSDERKKAVIQDIIREQRMDALDRFKGGQERQRRALTPRAMQ